MSGDKIKAAFLGMTDRGKASLAKSRDERAQRARLDIAAVRQQLAQIDDTHPDKEEWEKEASRCDDQVRSGLQLASVGDAYRALGKTCDDTKKLRSRVMAAGDLFGSRSKLGLLDLNLVAIQRTATMTPNADAAAKTRTALDVLKVERGAVGKDEKQAKTLLAKVEKARKEAEKGLQTKAEAGSDRAASRAALDGLAAVPELKEMLGVARGDSRGRRNAGQEAAARLDVFDAHFTNPGTDETARVENESMRTAAVIRAAAMQQARTSNDPRVAHRLGALMVQEYAPDIGLDPKAKALTTALVMDDPVEKLLTGKIRLENAVATVRDQAAVGGVQPAEMMRLLRNQFEMRMGSMDLKGDIEKVNLGPDYEMKPDASGTLQKDYFKFILSDLEGEVDAGWAVKAENFGPDGPKLEADGLAYGKALKAKLDAMEEEVALPDRPDQPDAAGARAPRTPNKPIADGDEAERPAAPDAKALQDAAAKLTNPAARTTRKAIKLEGDEKNRQRVVDSDGEYELVEQPITTPYVVAPGLGQSHKVTGPLRDVDDHAARHGALDPREYAHLRMLQRADAEDRDRVVAEKKGEKLKPEGVVIAYMKETYGFTDDGAVKALLDKVAQAFATVPLTITFTAESMFGADQDAPAHGTEYVSDVVYTRGRQDAASLIGRDDNIGIKPAPAPLALKRQQIAGIEAQIAAKAKGEPTDDLDRALTKAKAEEKKILKDLGPDGEREGATAGPQVGITGGAGGSWMDERGENYQRWRPDKDRREGRLDDRMLLQNAQTFGAVNPSFAATQGTSDEFMGKEEGRNYYGNAHFLLKDEVRGRAAFSVRGNSISVGGGKSSVQRTDLIMMLYDMICGKESNLRYIDAIALLAKGGAKALATATDWEIHIYGGFDMTKDAKSIYLSSKIQDPVRTRIANFAAKNGLTVATSIPDGKAVIVSGAPVKQILTGP